MSNKKDQEFKDKDNRREDNKIKKNRVTSIAECNKLSKFKQDPFWYAENEQAIKDMASFPFNDVMGSTYADGESSSVPGLVVARYYPTIGNSDAYNSGDYINKAADAYFQYLTQGFTGAVSFQASDLLCSALAASSLVARILDGARVFGILNFFTQMNKYCPRAIVSGLGYDYDDWMANRANFRSEYNIRVDKFNKTIALPKSFKICERWQFLNSMLFTDTTSPEYSTFYAWSQYYDLYYSSNTATTGTCLEWMLGTSGNMTVKEYFEKVDFLFESLNDDDVRNMFGALRRVYSDGDFKKLLPIDNNYVTPILKHDIVAMQFHNLNWISGTDISADAPAEIFPPQGKSRRFYTPIYQDEFGKLHSTIGVSLQGKITLFMNQDGKILFDLYDHMISPANVLDATATVAVPIPDQLVVREDKPSVSEQAFLPVVPRTELVQIVQLIRSKSTGDGFETVILPKCFSPNHRSTTSPDHQLDIPVSVLALTNVDSHPMIGTPDFNRTDETGTIVV